MSTQDVFLVMGELATSPASKKCIALKPNGAQCEHPRTSASKKYNENRLELFMLKHLCGQYKKIYLKDSGRLRFAVWISEVNAAIPIC